MAVYVDDMYKSPLGHYGRELGEMTMKRRNEK